MEQDVEKLFNLAFRGSEDDWERALELLRPAVKELEARFGHQVYILEDKAAAETDMSSRPDVALEEVVVKLLTERNLTITCAESCTGGLLSGRIINVPGVSDVYKAGFITYSNKAKRKLLGVKKSTLKKFGAVSKQTAREMAAGAAKAVKADVAVAVTGIAGPDGGTPEKPVGLVYIGCSVKGKVTVKKCQFSGSRSQIRESAVVAALKLVRMCVEKRD